MQEINTYNNPSDFDYDVDFRKLFYALLEAKWLIVSTTAFVSIIGVIFSLLLPNIYESKALLDPANSSSSITGALGGYSSLAGLAGINVPSSIDEDNSVKAIHKINSLSFFENSIMTNIYLPDLMAVKSWNSNTNALIYDKNIYDKKSGTWVRDFSYPQQQIPSAQESYKVFQEQHLSLSEDKKSGFITLSIKHQSPFVAKKWTELVVNEVNSFYRQKDKSESEKAVGYLNQQISMSGLSEIKQALAKLLQEETKKLALIEANEFYVFDYIDPPEVMETKSEPNRAIICILSTILGGILGIVLALIKYYVSQKKLHE